MNGMRHGHTFIIFQMSIQLFQHCYLQGHFHPSLEVSLSLDKISFVLDNISGFGILFPFILPIQVPQL